MSIPTMCLDERITDEKFGMKLFVDREKDVKKIKGRLRNMIDNSHISGRRLCIFGDRGVGKTILIRVILKCLMEETNCIALYVDAARRRNSTGLVKEVCNELGDKLRDIFEADERALAEIAYMKNISHVNKITRGWMKSTAEELEVSGGIGIGFLGFLKASLGLRKGKEMREEIAETVEIEVNIDFLGEMLTNIVGNIKGEKIKDVLICLDNLDQLEVKEEIETLTAEMYKIENALVITVIRSEGMTRNLRRNVSAPSEIEGISEEDLMEILGRRLGVIASEEERKELKKGGIFEVAQQLTNATDKPYYFLKWLNYLYLNTDINEKPSEYKEYLKGYVEALYRMFGFDELRRLHELFSENDYGFLPKDKIVEYLGISNGEFNRLLDQEVIIPDNLFNPNDYRLSPDLYLLKIYGGGR